MRVHGAGAEVPPPWVAIPETWLDVLDESIKHRGPDGNGRFRDRAVRADGATVDVALVHRRLSIIDHAGGHQPMVLFGAGGAGERRNGLDHPSDRPFSSIPPGADAAPYRRTIEHALKACPRCASLGRGTVAVVFNGCIYNHRELRAELRAAGHEFSTDHSDTEVLVHGWGEWGAQLPRRLEAMASVAAWDASRGEAFVFRDRWGEKPLFYTHDERHTFLMFASSAAALQGVLATSEFPRAMVRSSWWSEPAQRVKSISHWVSSGGAGYLPLFDTMPLGQGDQFKLFRRTDEDPAGPGLQAWTEERAEPRDRPLESDSLEVLLEAAVASRLEADVPLGVFLSGGVDSSLIAMFANRRAGRVATFSVRMPDDRYDESAQAAAVAKIIGSDHQVLDCAAQPGEDLVGLIHQCGIPFGDSSLLPAHWVSRAARQHVAVALSGDGGDEAFGGYERYRGARVLSWARPLLAVIPTGVLPRRDPKARATKLTRLIDASRSDGYADLLRVFSRSTMRRLMPGAPLGPLGGLDPPFHAVASAIDRDVDDYLPDDLLRKTDTASMAVALEVRAPFLDRCVMESALSAPIHVLMPRGERKGLLRAVARKYFPPSIVDRPKMGFAIPVGEWFRSDFGGMRQLLRDHLEGPEPFGAESLGINSMIDMRFVRQMLREHDEAGEKSIWPWKGRDHSQRLYMLLVLSIWAKWLGEVAGGR